jgi:asparagine synthase (glutamine-hydrolysing)
MCGICGYVGTHAPDLLAPMCLRMAHRGPDDMGSWHDPLREVGLGHRRLSIIDLSPAGHQPMSNEDGTVWISYNGEVYNFQELREGLLARGHRFRSRTDTEVLVHLYEEKGTEFLEEVNGIFALAVWDGVRGQLLLARDHAGVKPLYYWCDGRRLFFASEIKALMCVPGIPRQINHEAIPAYLTFLWVPGEDTMFRGIRKLEPGHSLVWRDGRLTVRQWFSLSYEPDDAVSEADWIERVHETFMRVTRRQMVSDVPLGAFLSGGLDSSSIVVSMRQAFPQRPIKCYTAYFDPGDLRLDQMVDDYPYARRVADTLGVDLHSFVLRPQVISMLPKMVYHLDEPDADPAVFPSYMISKMARDDGTVVLLSGTGGDEVFFGYRSHQAYRGYARLRRVPRWLAGPLLGGAQSLATRLLGAQGKVSRRIRKFKAGLIEDGLQRHLSLVDWSSPATRRSLYGSGLSANTAFPEPPPAAMKKYYDGFRGTGELNLHSHILIQTFLAAHNFLYTDKSSMAASVEARVPYMDVELMRLSARIPERFKLKGRITKHVLKRAMERHLPHDVLYRSKTGFGAPLRKWLVEDLRGVVADLLSPVRIRQRGLFEPSAVQRVLKENDENRADHAYLIYTLLTLEVWQQTFIDRAAEVVSW